MTDLRWRLVFVDATPWWRLHEEDVTHYGLDGTEWQIETAMRNGVPPHLSFPRRARRIADDTTIEIPEQGDDHGHVFSGPALTDLRVTLAAERLHLGDVRQPRVQGLLILGWIDREIAGHRVPVKSRCADDLGTSPTTIERALREDLDGITWREAVRNQRLAARLKK